MHATLLRLDDLATHLADRGDVLAVLGLGSAGEEHDRFDEHSDIDFFVVTEDDAKARYVDDLCWLAAMGRLGYSFANEPHGRKALFEDGLFVEYAVFTMSELRDVPYSRARVVWARPDVRPELPSSNRTPGASALDTAECHLNEALTNLFVGLHRELRGERLTAMRFIQVHAVDRSASLLRLTRTTSHRRDPFEPTRRLEQAFDDEQLPLADMAPGYARNVAAARTTLDWLTARFDADPVIVGAIEELLRACEADAR